MVNAQVQESNRQRESAERADAPWPRIGAACGLAFVLLQFTALGFMSSGGWLDPGASKADIVKAFARTPSSQLWIGVYLSALAAFCFIPFGVRVATSRSRGEPGSEWLSTVALGGGFLLVAAELSGVGAVDALLTRAGHNLSTAEAMTLFDLAQALLFLFWVGGTLFLAASAVLPWQFRTLPRWLGGAAAVIAALSLISPASTQLLHIPATMFYLWVIAASIILMRVPGEPHADRRNRSGTVSIAE